VSGTLASGLLHGPWDQAFFFELPGTVRSKSNARRFTGSQQERAAYADNRAFARQVALIAQACRPAGWQLGAPPPSPLQARPQVVAAVLARSTLDATNVPKSLHDAVEGIVFHNDASVRGAAQVTVRGRAGGGLVAFARLSPDTSPAEASAATAALLAALTARAADLELAGFGPAA
jgi:hypothetical protein